MLHNLAPNADMLNSLVKRADWEMSRQSCLCLVGKRQRDMWLYSWKIAELTCNYKLYKIHCVEAGLYWVLLYYWVAKYTKLHRYYSSQSPTGSPGEAFWKTRHPVRAVIWLCAGGRSGGQVPEYFKHPDARTHTHIHSQGGEVTAGVVNKNDVMVRRKPTNQEEIPVRWLMVCVL